MNINTIIQGDKTIKLFKFLQFLLNLLNIINVIPDMISIKTKTGNNIASKIDMSELINMALPKINKYIPNIANVIQQNKGKDLFILFFIYFINRVFYRSYWLLKYTQKQPIPKPVSAYLLFFFVLLLCAIT